MKQFAEQTFDLNDENGVDVISNRYCVCQKVWCAWKEYVLIEKVKDAKKSVAIVHGEYESYSTLLTLSPPLVFWLGTFLNPP